MTAQNPPSTAPVAFHTPPSLMAQLRARTDNAHRRLEQVIRVEARLADPAQYTALLQCFLGIYRPLEQRLEDSFPHGIAELDLHTRRKSHWLEQDLCVLAAQPSVESNDLPPLQTEDQALGCMYVLEGSTLGGQMIARMARETLGLDTDSGGRFFHGYGSETGARWRAFGTAANAAARSAEVVIQSAEATFAAFERWAARPETFPSELS